MYERSYGYRYKELGDHPSAAAIAKAVRADVKQAQQEGLLPTRWNYSVRSETFSGGCSIDIEVRECPDAWQACDGGQGCHNVWCSAREDPKYAHAAEQHNVMTEEAEAAKMTLQRIHNAYNHDGSEIMVDYFDVRYYGTIRFETAGDADFRRRKTEKLATKKAAREGGTVIGKVANYGRDGRPVIHVLIETSEGEKVLACGARVSSHSFIQRVTAETPVTCSRCSKHQPPHIVAAPTAAAVRASIERG